MKSAIYPGTFDPLTNGHIDIIRRSARLFDELTVAVLVNKNKSPVFSLEKRIEMITRMTLDIANVKVDSFEGLLAEYARQKKVTAIVRGLRATSDFENEFQMALANSQLNPDVETIFLNTTGANLFINSSMVKEIASLGGDISGFVPEPILNDILLQMRK